ncbi:four helix bundle protein [Bacteroides thetaiotaomicron]|uniref:four helix bundle protein n=1 Tax=Bacteroides thetaiotaomicron TaxID=818 RepID=UPI001F28F8B5|nr:four helix bundle protein [Bacteroides thetaiotaomicron]MCE8780840.1 four helix bundle protein [Bacteroides thetaiotaomicron]
MKNSVTHVKSKAFAVRIIRFYKYLTDEKREYTLANQILRSGTSIGANVRESYSAQSKADFVNKLSIALKEADETLYWLELFVESEIITQSEFDSMATDLKEISALLASSIKTAKNRVKSKENRAAQNSLQSKTLKE